MHELSITQSILSIVLEKAEAAQASRIVKVNITMGKLSGVVDDCVQFYFELLSKDTIAAGASISFYQSPTKLRCRNCANVFMPADIDWTCPNCHSQGVEIISGRECFVESIEVE